MRSQVLLTIGWLLLGATTLTAQGDARFSARSELVVLNVAVTDDRGGFVSGLPAEAFRVFEEGRAQRVSFFAEQDTPATIGLLIDSSGSMLVSRDRMIAGITSLAEASHPDDEFLPLVFNERVTPVLSPPGRFTSDPVELCDALTRNLIVLGKTAFHDALSEALDGITAGAHERRVLIVLSDGGDNASRMSFDEVLEKVHASNVVIYTIALLDPVSLDPNPGALRRLAKATGGLAFQPRSVAVVGTAFRKIAADIRSRYTLAFEPADTAAGSGVRRVRVVVDVPGRGDLRVRTRTAYLGGAAPVTAGYGDPR
jgi:Ca-activated chloride channel homolog